jgi:hypothetical protein
VNTSVSVDNNVVMYRTKKDGQEILVVNDFDRVNFCPFHLIVYDCCCAHRPRKFIEYAYAPHRKECIMRAVLKRPYILK